MIKQPFGSDRTIRRYLLNELSAEDQSRFEEAYFSDGNLFEQIQALEEELITDYVNGHLSGHKRRLFERHYLASDQRRAKIETAGQLVEVCSLKKPSQIVSDNGIMNRFFSPRAPFRWAVEWRLVSVYGIAVAVLLSLATGFVFELLRLRGQLAAVNEDRAAVKRRAEESEQRLDQERRLLAEERKRGDDLREKLENLDGRTARLAQGRAGFQSLSNQIVFLTLTPGVRDIYNSAKARVSDDARFVELRAVLETQDEAKSPSYRAVVTTVAGAREIWTQEGIKAQLRKSSLYVVVRVPAERFKASGEQDFMLTFSAGATNGKDHEEAEHYHFQVIASRD